MPSRTEPRVMTPEELREFRLRTDCQTAATMNLRIIEEGNTAWLTVLKKKYRIRGEMQVDLNTGTMIPKPKKKDTANGR